VGGLAAGRAISCRRRRVGRHRPRPPQSQRPDRQSLGDERLEPDTDRAKALAASPQFQRFEFIYGYPNAIRELGELLST
jgi:hypothetical protein